MGAGAASGVGTFAVQLARELGATHALNRRLRNSASITSTSASPAPSTPSIAAGGREAQA